MPSLFDPEPVGGPDPELDAVEAKLRRLSGPDPEAFFAGVIRQSIDEVLDGPRTGRWDFGELEKTEKTYVGTKLEIVTRIALKLERGPVLDLEIEGAAVDIKWAMNSSWQIPREAVGQICLCVGGRKKLSMFQVGVVRCRSEYLNKGKNQDSKRTLSADGRAALRLLVPPAPLPPNFLSTIDPAIAAEVMKGRTVQERVTRLFKLVPRTPIPRSAVTTVASTPNGDPMRRSRADAWAGDTLGGMKAISAKYGSRLVVALGYPELEPETFFSVPAAEIAALPEAEKALLTDNERKLYFD